MIAKIRLAEPSPASRGSRSCLSLARSRLPRPKQAPQPQQAQPAEPSPAAMRWPGKSSS